MPFEIAVLNRATISGCYVSYLRTNIIVVLARKRCRCRMRTSDPVTDSNERRVLHIMIVLIVKLVVGSNDCICMINKKKSSHSAHNNQWFCPITTHAERSNLAASRCSDDFFHW